MNSTMNTTFKNRTVYWGSQTNEYEERLQSIRKLHDSVVHGASIELDEKLSQTENKINCRTRRLLEASYNQEVNEFPRIQDFIQEKINLDYQKYVDYDSGSEHSSEEEIKLKYDIEEIVGMANKDPTPGKIIFITKIIKCAGIDFELTVQNIKPKKVSPLQIIQLRDFQNFILCQFMTDSAHKKIAIHLNINDKSIRSTQQLNFSTKSIFLDLNIGYDFTQGVELRINPLETLLSASVLDGEKLVNEILGLHGKKALRQQILEGNFRIDLITQNFIDKAMRIIPLMKVLKFLLEKEDKREEYQFGQTSEETRTTSFNVIAKIFLELMLRFKPSAMGDSDQLQPAEIVSFFELYLHLVCSTFSEPTVNNYGIESGSFQEIKGKMGDIINFLFQNREMTLYNKIMDFCIDRSTYILPIGYDTMKEHISQCGLNSANFTLAHFQNIVYHIGKNKEINLTKCIIEAFGSYKFQTSNIYAANLTRILELSEQIFQRIETSSMNCHNFLSFYQIYSLFRRHEVLYRVVDNISLKGKISDYLKSIKTKLSTAPDSDKLVFLKILERVNIQERDQDLIDKDVELTSMLPILIKINHKNNIIIEDLIRIYFEMLKRTGSIFSEQALRSSSISICKTLQLFQIEGGLNLLNKHFKDDILHNSLFVSILSETILQPLINKNLPEQKQTLKLLSDQNHRKWHHNFKYREQINEMLIQKMLKVINRFVDNHYDKTQYVQQIILELKKLVTDEDQRNTLMAIINTELVELSEEKLWVYFTKEWGYLKSLNKIREKNDSRSDQLMKSLKEVARTLQKQSKPFEVIQNIKKMKPNEEHNFRKLTQDYDIPKMLDDCYATGSAYVEKINKLINFVREVGQKFNSPDTQKIIDDLNSCLKEYLKESMKEMTLQSKLPLFRNFQSEILKCFRFDCFYQGKKLNDMKINLIIEQSNQYLIQMKRIVRNLYEDCKNKTLKSSSFYFFNPRKDKIRQFYQILTIIDADIPEDAEIIKQIYKVITICKDLEHQIHALTTIQGTKFNLREAEIIQIETICRNLAKKNEFNVSEIITKYQAAKQKLKQYKINLDTQESKDILNLFLDLTENKGLFELLKDINPFIRQIKDKINDVGGGLVSSEELYYCEIVYDFMTNVYMKDYPQFSNFMASILKFYEDKKKISKHYNLSTMVQVVIKSSDALREEKENLKNQDRNFFKHVECISQKVVISYQLDKVNKDKVKSRIHIFPDGEQKELLESEFQDYKEKALMMSSTIPRNEQDKERIKDMPKFIKICNNHEQMKEKEQKLADVGCLQFSDRVEVIEIISGDDKKIKQKIEEKKRQADVWKQNIDTLVDSNFKASQLQGKLLSEFYHFIANSQNKEVPSEFSTLFESDNIYFQVKNDPQFISEIKKAKTPEECLKIISKCLMKVREKEKEIMGQNIEIGDEEEDFLHFHSLSNEDRDYFSGIQELMPERIGRLRFEQLLICTKETNIAQINAFIEAALRDTDNQYVMLGFENLSRSHQQNIVDRIKEYQRRLAGREREEDRKFKLKLCLVGNSEIELLYQFTKEMMSKPEEQSSATISESQKAYNKRLEKETANVYIVASEQAGDGKSTFIKQHSKKKYGCSRQYHLTLSGNMLSPVGEGSDEHLCEKYLWDIYKKMADQLTAIQKRRKASNKKEIETCIVIDLYNIENLSLESVNKFLLNILFFRKHKYTTSQSIPSNVPIYVELQNISSSFNVKLKNKDLPVQINLLPFLRELWVNCRERVVQKIQRLSIQTVKVENQDNELQFILNFLLALDDKTINTKFLPNFDQFKKEPKPIPQNKGKELINKYFFNEFEANDKPSGYLWTYFRTLLFTATNNFSNSYFLSELELKQLDADILKKGGTNLHNSIKLKQTFRKQFLQVIVRNCVQFIKRSVKHGDQGSSGSLQETLKNIPLLIIPEVDGSSFSFIYNKSDKVPTVIKQMIVLSNFSLLSRIQTVPIDTLFEEANIANMEQKNQKQWVEKASEVLRNISGNMKYSIDCEPGYVINIDNFFKICLIVYRMRSKIPIVIMGEAGIGKTALLRHVVKHLFHHEFKVFNINAGLPLISLKTQEQNKMSNKKNSQGQNTKSLKSMIESLKISYKAMKADPLNQKKKIWVFFDEFNTLKEIGYFKEIIMDKRFLGEEDEAFKECIMMAACNPYKKLKKRQHEDQIYTLQKQQKLAFDVLPTPHSLVENMWNYGSLNNYEYEKYISKMLNELCYEKEKMGGLILAIHDKIKSWSHESAVSLRDIERLRQIYKWFIANLQPIRTKNISPILNSYNINQKRAAIMTLYFTYLLRFNTGNRKELEMLIEQKLGLGQGFVRAAKDIQQEDFCSRLNKQWDTPLVFNQSLKENIYTCFICLNTRLPLIIIGSPGSSKSLSLRLLLKNLEKSQDKFISKRIERYSIQGSENTTTNEIKTIFERVQGDLTNKVTKERVSMAELQRLNKSYLVVFDEIGLAEKSPDNPLKVLHPYLEVSREDDSDERVISFIGISNSELDVSKMSRLLVLRRPPINSKDLQDTAIQMAAGAYNEKLSIQINHYVECLAKSYQKYLNQWKSKKNAFLLFYGLRDFYGLIKNFITKILEKKERSDEREFLTNCACQSIFENFNGWESSYQQFAKIFFDYMQFNDSVKRPTMNEILSNITNNLKKQSSRYPLVIAQDQESLNFLKWMIECHFKEKSNYIEGSPFNENKEYSSKLLARIGEMLVFESVLIVTNLKEAVKTGLYEFFNKSVELTLAGSKQITIKSSSKTNNRKSYDINDKFNCLYLLLAKDLINVEPPFLNRFQKYRFNLKSYRMENCDPIFKKVANFKTRITEICQANNYKHFSFQDLFMNAGEGSLESLAVSSYEKTKNQAKRGEKQKSQEESSEESFREALRKLVMNSGQEFYFLLKFVIEKNGELADLRDFINEVITKKNQKENEEQITTIKFTNQKNYLSNINNQESGSLIQFETLKKQSDLQNDIKKFFENDAKQELFIWMRVLEDSQYLNFILSLIEKVRRIIKPTKPEAVSKKIKLVYWFTRGRVSPKGEKEIEIPITHFSHIPQEFDDGKVGDMARSKEQIFNSVINMPDLLKYIHDSFEFTFQNQENAKRTQLSLNLILKELIQNKQNLFQDNCQEIAMKLESNFQLGEENIKEILQDKGIIKSQSFKVALTRFFADKKLFGAIGTFIKYLTEKESYLSYSEDSIFEYLRNETYPLNYETINDFKNVKKSKKYKQFVKETLKNKVATIIGDYRQLKMLKRLPNPSKKYQLKISKPRLIPFSKVECLTILKLQETQLGWHAKQVYKNPEKHKQAFQNFVKEFKFKTTFKNSKDNFYRKYIEQQSEKDTKANPFVTMLFLDLLSDFVEDRELELKYVFEYFQIMLPIISFKDNANRFAKMVCVLLGFEQIWIELFRLIAVFLNQDSKILINFKTPNTISREVMIEYSKYIVDQIEIKLLAEKSVEEIGNAEKFHRMFINAAFQMQKLQTELDVKIPDRVKSIRTAIVFLEQYDPTLKSERMHQFIARVSQDKRLSYYEHALNFFDSLGDEADEEKIKILTEFKANTLFLEWFKSRRTEAESKKCFEEFVENCKNQVFAHNSVSTISHFVESLKPQYQGIKTTYQKFNCQDSNEGRVSKELLMIGQHSKKSNYTDNLSLVIVNLFMQKISSFFQGSSIITQKYRDLEEIIDKITSTESYGVARHYAYAFIKVYLQRYIDSFVAKESFKEFDAIDKILSNKESSLCSNFRFYCLKLLRTKMTIKEIVNDYIKKKKCQWISLVNEIEVFKQNQSRALTVPKNPSKTSDKMSDIMKEVIDKEGRPDNFDLLFQEGSLSADNRYSLLTFFFRLYFSKAYNYMAHRQAVLDKLQKEKTKYEGLIGIVQFELILRYAKSEFDEKIKIQTPEQFNQSILFLFNPLNWLLATKQSVSPLNSLFLDKGKFHQKFKPVFDTSFFPCGPENPFINIAQAVLEATRSDDVGVYICSSKCDYLYFHGNCGWPAQTVPCRICGESIGCKPGRGHTLSRDDQGARRVMSSQLKDTSGNFYMWSMGKVPLYNESQRYYIEAEINRMKVNPIVTLAGKKIDLRGYLVQNQGRVSTLTYYLFRQIIDSLLYTLISLKVVTPEQTIAINKTQTVQQAQKLLWDKHQADVEFIDKALNLDKKLYGWMFGVHNFIFDLSSNFQEKFNSYRLQIQERSRKLANQMTQLVNSKKISSAYFQLYKDIALNLNNGLVSKEFKNITDMTAKNRMTRDAFQDMLERFIKENTTQRKFNLSENSRVLQGMMQFPNDSYLTEDTINEGKFQLSRLFKLPDKVIKYSEIVNSFQAVIKNKYPLLDYILKNSETINNMTDFETILQFSNQLNAEVENTYERKDAERSLEDFLKELKEKRQNKLHRVLTTPKLAIQAWNRLAKKLGPLQNNCTLVGRMNDEYSLETEVKAFLIDNVSKKNPYGLILSSVLHNFAVMHNSLMNTLNSRKNQIPQYKVLNLVNFSKTMSPQNIKENSVYTITQKELSDKLYECSISSVSYGKNFIFTNFESFQHYFIMKLQGKCEFLSEINKFKSICYNGEAFASTSDSSNFLTEVRNYFYVPLEQEQRHKVKVLIRGDCKSKKQIEECCVIMRGELEKIMIGIKNLGGIVEEVNITDFTNNNKIETNSVEIVELGYIEINKIVPLYELVELQMKDSVIEKLSDQYKAKISTDVQNEITVLFEELPIQESEMSVTLVQFGEALYRFMARNLQSGLMDKDKKIMHFLPQREDFWPKDFGVEKLQPLIENPIHYNLPFENICALFAIVEKIIHKKVGASKI